MAPTAVVPLSSSVVSVSPGAAVSDERRRMVLSISRSDPQMSSAVGSQLIWLYPSLGETSASVHSVALSHALSSKSTAVQSSGAAMISDWQVSTQPPILLHGPQ